MLGPLALLLETYTPENVAQGNDDGSWVAVILSFVLFFAFLWFISTSQPSEENEQCEKCKGTHMFQYFKDPLQNNIMNLAGFCPNCGKELDLLANHEAEKVKNPSPCTYCKDASAIHYITDGNKTVISKAKHCPKCGKALS